MTEMPPRPPWHGPPDDVLPGIVPVMSVLAKNEKVAVCISHFAVYQVYFAASVRLFVGVKELTLGPLFFADLGQSFLEHQDVQESMGKRNSVDEMWRLCVQFPDGKEAASTEDVIAARAWAQNDRSRQPLIFPGGGRGRARCWERDYWIWPLPSAGILAFTYEWPEAGIELTRWEIDAQGILDAAARAQVVFSREQLPSDDA